MWCVIIDIESIIDRIWQIKLIHHSCRVWVQERLGFSGEWRGVQQVQIVSPYILLQQRQHRLQLRPTGLVLLHQRSRRTLRERAEDDHQGSRAREPAAAAVQRRCCRNRVFSISCSPYDDHHVIVWGHFCLIFGAFSGTCWTSFFITKKKKKVILGDCKRNLVALFNLFCVMEFDFRFKIFPLKRISLACWAISWLWIECRPMIMRLDMNYCMLKDHRHLS